MTPTRPLAVGLSITGAGDDDADLVREAERLGVHSIWTAETWAYDALTPLAYWAAHTTKIKLASGIVQLGARTPSMLAMSAMSMQALSHGRFILGVGVSGPQVIEGWHGVPFDEPLARTRETIEIVRMITRGERAAYEGSAFHLPMPGGAGRPMRSGAPPVDVPIWIAALGPKNLRMTGELADGWIGQTVIPESVDVFVDPIAEGARAAGRSLDDVTLSAMVSVELGADTEEIAGRHARGYAFTIGAMGTGDRNFYNNAFSRQGFGDAVAEVHDLWQSGQRDRAADKVPLELALKTNLLGEPKLVKERLRTYRAAGIGLLRAGLAGADLGQRLESLGTLVDLVTEVNREP